ncbi:MAG: hypothetical protein ACJ8OJ_23430 [Povalibacter sp.]
MSRQQGTEFVTSFTRGRIFTRNRGQQESQQVIIRPTHKNKVLM